MKVNVKGHIRDLLAFRGLLPQRRKRIARAQAQPIEPGLINELAHQLHPERQFLSISEIREESGTTKTFRLIPGRNQDSSGLAFFRAGQYVSVKIDLAGVRVSRPYSISSAPSEALGPDGFYEITIKKKEDGFVTRHIWDSWDIGTEIESSGPCGNFYYEPLRDADKIVGLAGGSGITPFRSMAREIAYGDLKVELLLIYGSADEDDIIFYDELEQLERDSSGQVKAVHVLSCEEVTLEGCEQGFITADIIRKHTDIDHSTFFICGPHAMHRFLSKELATLDLPSRRVRRELLGQPPSIAQVAGFPHPVPDTTFQLSVRVGDSVVQVPARATESVLVALERANLAPPSQCRSGECGFCRALVHSGDVFVNPDGDGRRFADRQFGFIHTCSTYPISDLEIEILRRV